MTLLLVTDMALRGNAQRSILHRSPGTHWWYHSFWRWQKAPLGQALPGNGASTHVKLAQLPPLPPHCAYNSKLL